MDPDLHSEREVILVRSIVLRPHEKSLRRLRLKPKTTSNLLKVGLTTSTKRGTLTVPQSSMAGMTYQGKPVFLNRLTVLEQGDDLLNPVLSSTVRYRLCPDKDNLHLIHYKRDFIINSNQHPGDRVTTDFEVMEDDLPGSWICKPCEVLIESGYLYTYKEMESGFTKTFAIINQSLISTLSNKFDHVFSAHLYECARRSKTKPDLNLSEITSTVLSAVAESLRSFQVHLHFLGQRCYSLARYLSPEHQNILRMELIAKRIEVMEVLLEFSHGPLQVLRQSAQAELPRLPALDWVEGLDSRLNALQSALEGPCEYSELFFRWELCSWSESDTRFWVQLKTGASEATLRQFVNSVEKSYHTKCETSGLTNNPLHETQLELCYQVSSVIIPIDKAFAIHAADDPNYKPDWSVSIIGSSSNIPTERTMDLLPIVPTISSVANSYLLPPLSHRKDGCLEVTRPDRLIKLTPAAEDYVLEITVAKKYPVSIPASFTPHTEPGLWSCTKPLRWPSTAVMEGETAEVEGWFPIIMEFTQNQLFVICKAGSRLYLRTLFPFEEAEDRDVNLIEILSPAQRWTYSEFQRLLLDFYSEYYEPHRSESLSYIESDHRLLWAVQLADNDSCPPDTTRLWIMLTDWSLNTKNVALQTQNIFNIGVDWLPIHGGACSRLELDVRSNQNLSFQFTWRVVTGRVIGLLLRSCSEYIIFAKRYQRFIILCRRQYGAFEDYYMTDVMPFTPGLGAICPILIRKCHTLRLHSDHCSTELVELTLKIV